MKPAYSLSCWQEYTNGPYPRPGDFWSHEYVLVMSALI
jgi:hypothetical protein